MKYFLMLLWISLIVPAWSMANTTIVMDDQGGLHVEWEYTPTENPHEGFKLYAGDTGELTATFGKDDRAGDFAYTLDGCEGFYMTTYGGEYESKVSNIYVLCPPPVVLPPVTRFFIIPITRTEQ